MRTAQIEVAGKKLLLVEVPAEFKNFVIKNYGYAGKWLMETDSKELNHWQTNLPKGNSYSILGTITSTEIDFDCSDIVEQFNNPIAVFAHGKFYDYSQHARSHTVADKLFDSPKDSFHSLLSSQGIHFKNPLGEKPDTKNYQSTADDIDHEDWLAGEYLVENEKWNESEKQLWKRAVVIEIK